MKLIYRMSLFIDNNKEFDINNAKIHIIDNNPYYVLPENTKIYFGSKSKVFNKQPTFFGFDYKTAKKYGFVKTFTTNKELRLLALMELTPEHSFYKNADEKWKNKMQIIFGVGVGQQDKTRNSVGTSDRKMMDYLCNTPDMHGYAMNGNYKGDTFHGNNFHAELVLCNPTKDTYIIDEEDHNKTSTPPRLQRKTNPRLQAEEEEEDLYLNMGLNSSSYGSPPITPVKLHSGPGSFVTPGGKGKNKKTKRKLRKSKKSKRKLRKTRKN